MFIWLRFTLPQFASYLSSFQTDPNQRQIINKFYDSFGQKIIAVHLKDFVFKTGNLQMAALGTGMFDQQYFLTETAKRYPYMYCLLESISREQVPAAINLISKWVEIEP